METQDKRQSDRGTIQMANKVFKNIPSVNELLESPQLRNLVDKVSHNVVVSEVRTFLDGLRGDLKTAAEEMQVLLRRN